MLASRPWPCSAEASPEMKTTRISAQNANCSASRKNSVRGAKRATTRKDPSESSEGQSAVNADPHSLYKLPPRAPALVVKKIVRFGQIVNNSTVNKSTRSGWLQKLPRTTRQYNVTAYDIVHREEGNEHQRKPIPEICRSIYLLILSTAFETRFHTFTAQVGINTTKSKIHASHTKYTVVLSRHPSASRAQLCNIVWHHHITYSSLHLLATTARYRV